MFVLVNSWQSYGFFLITISEKYKRAIVLIKKGKAYVCDLSQEEIVIFTFAES